MSDKVIPVRVAMRCRPLIPKERNEGCETCLSFIPGEEQVLLGNDKAFTFDYVFTPDTPQVEVFERSVLPLVEGIFKGYNATVLAYGQTGSGKTYSMGGGYGISLDTSSDIVGIIPRVISQLFDGIEENSTEYDFVVRVSYLEIYKEDLIDLLQPQSSSNTVSIREFEAGNIKLVGLTERVVGTPLAMLQCLTDGAAHRTTAATAMNTESSRSHAIFTVYIDRTNKQDSQDFTRSKFHLVDLAGSERQKKTKAEGERLKEGININKGLLSLGNVISALGDEAQRAKYVPYRDSKLTRLLQDSLGGNSHTVMIACCSPADSNAEETLSTMRYADRARKIKNKPVVNRDPQVAEIMRLKAIVQDLQMQMVNEGIAIKPISNVPSGDRAGGGGTSAEAMEELKKLRDSNKQLQEKVKTLQRDLEQAWEQIELQCAKVILLETQKEAISEQLASLKCDLQDATLNMTTTEGSEASKSIVKAWQERIEDIERTQNGDFERMLNVSSSHDSNETQTATEETASMDTTTSGETNTADITGTNLADFEREAQRKHDENKAKLFRTLNDLNKRLMEKEQLMKNMEQSDGVITQMRSDYEGSIKEKEDLISKLQNEKDQLESQLKQSKVDANLGKVNEMRRKKIQDLETELKERKKALADTNKMLRMKENSTKDMDRLKRDIIEMKQQRVRLMKQIKADNEEFRKFKQQKDKEVIQLKAQERKRMVEINKLKSKFDVQQAVLKRKNEEAAALSKRLNENLLRQRKAIEDKAKKDQNQSESKKARIAKLLNQELELVVGMEEARQSKEELVNDRRQLSEQLAHLKEELENAPANKRQQLNNSSARASDEKTATLRRQIKDIEMQIKVKSSHIHDLQNKLMEADQGERNKRPFYDDLRSMTEYRMGMNHLISKVKNSRIAHIKQRSANEDLASEADELHKQLEDSEQALQALKAEHSDELTRIQAHYEQKQRYFVAELKKKQTNSGQEISDTTQANANKEQMNQILALNEELQSTSQKMEISTAREEMLRQQILLKDREIEDLRKELTKRAYKARTTEQSLMPKLNETITYSKGSEVLPGMEVLPAMEDDPEPSFFSDAMLTTPAPSKQRRRTQIFENETTDEEDDEEEEEEEVDYEHQEITDPEWMKGATPGYSTHRLHSKLPTRMSNRTLSNDSQRNSLEKHKNGNLTASNEALSSSMETSTTISITSATPPSDVRCRCKGSCSTKRCACFKTDGRCGDYCKCTNVCENRELQLPESTTNDEEVSQSSTMFNTTFVKEDDLSQDVLRDTTNTTATTVSSQEEVSQPRKFRKSGDASREAIREGSDTTRDNTSASDLSLEGIAKPARKRKLGKKTSQFFNPV